MHILPNARNVLPLTDTRFFPPKHIPEFSTFQDGGVLQNNPTIIGLSKFSALSKDTSPDLIINLGTGSDPEPKITNDKQMRFWRYR